MKLITALKTITTTHKIATMVCVGALTTTVGTTAAVAFSQEQPKQVTESNTPIVMNNVTKEYEVSNETKLDKTFVTDNEEHNNNTIASPSVENAEEIIETTVEETNNAVVSNDVTNETTNNIENVVDTNDETLPPITTVFNQPIQETTPVVKEENKTTSVTQKEQTTPQVTKPQPTITTTKPQQTKPAETTPQTQTATKPVETQPTVTETQPAKQQETKPAETTPQQTQPVVETKPAETTPQTQPVVETPAPTQPVAETPTPTQPVETTPVEPETYLVMTDGKNKTIVEMSKEEYYKWLDTDGNRYILQKFVENGREIYTTGKEYSTMQLIAEFGPDVVLGDYEVCVGGEIIIY